MTNQAYIINEFNQLVAPTVTDLKNGASVEYAFQTTTVFWNADQLQGSLVNKRKGKISRAKKWNKVECYNSAKSHKFEDEFLVS